MAVPWYPDGHDYAIWYSFDVSTNQHRSAGRWPHAHLAARYRLSNDSRQSMVTPRGMCQHSFRTISIRSDPSSHPWESSHNHSRYFARSTRRFHARNDAVFPRDRVTPVKSIPCFGPKTSSGTALTMSSPAWDQSEPSSMTCPIRPKASCTSQYGNPEGLRDYNRFCPDLWSRSWPILIRR